MKIYKYMYFKVKAGGLFTETEHRTVIDQYSQEGWRFIAAIPLKSGSYGQIKEVDLVFEKEE